MFLNECFCFSKIIQSSSMSCETGGAAPLLPICHYLQPSVTLLWPDPNPAKTLTLSCITFLVVPDRLWCGLQVWAAMRVPSDPNRKESHNSMSCILIFVLSFFSVQFVSTFIFAKQICFNISLFISMCEPCCWWRIATMQSVGLLVHRYGADKYIQYVFYSNYRVLAC